MSAHKTYLYTKQVIIFRCSDCYGDFPDATLHIILNTGFRFVYFAYMNNTRLLNKRKIFVVKVRSERVKAIKFPIQCPGGYTIYGYAVTTLHEGGQKVHSHNPCG